MTMASSMVLVGIAGFIVLWASRHRRHRDDVCRRYTRATDHANFKRLVAAFRRHDR